MMEEDRVPATLLLFWCCFMSSEMGSPFLEHTNFDSESFEQGISYLHERLSRLARNVEHEVAVRIYISEAASI